jgi:hypothetical protein
VVLVLAPIPEEVVPMAVEVGTVVVAVVVVGLALAGEGAAGEDIKQPVHLRDGVTKYRTICRAKG